VNRGRVFLYQEGVSMTVIKSCTIQQYSVLPILT
jgi:hypothetical protein